MTAPVDAHANPHAGAALGTSSLEKAWKNKQMGHDGEVGTVQTVIRTAAVRGVAPGCYGLHSAAGCSKLLHVTARAPTTAAEALAWAKDAMVSTPRPMIRCSACRKGVLVPGRTKDHDIGPLLGLERVLLNGAPALVCESCDHVVLEGEVIEAARRKLAELIVRNGGVLTGSEARFLRETMGMSQAQLAERLGIIRGTVTRWEAGEDLGAVQSFALRTLAAWVLDSERLPHIVSAPEMPRPSLPVEKPYRIDGMVPAH